jgi:hypothetical protein
MKPDALTDLQAAFATLDGPQRRTVQLALCRHALGIWEAYLRRHRPVAYVDSEGAAIDDWLIVNQALAAEDDPARWRTLLATALQPAQR